MKSAFHKSTIPESRIFVIQHLREKHFDPVWHSHAEYQLFVNLEGTGTRFIGDNISSFKPGELTLMGANLPHLWRSDEGYFKKESHLKTNGIVIYFKEIQPSITKKIRYILSVNRNKFLSMFYQKPFTIFFYVQLLLELFY